MSFYAIFFTQPHTSETYTLSLHDALPISVGLVSGYVGGRLDMLLMRIVDVMFSIPPIILAITLTGVLGPGLTDRKSTRLNSSHMSISYAVFCLKKKKIL